MTPKVFDMTELIINDGKSGALLERIGGSPQAIQPPAGRLRFGQFDFDPRSGELRKQGRRIRLEGQPVQILARLLAAPGELVTREELQQELWPADTFVNFEQSLNAAVKRLRRALSDAPRNPRFVETLARRGYRFIAPVEGTPAASAECAIRSVAVLPFENVEGDPETEYLGDGIADSIINSLSRLASVRVMARSTVSRYKAKDLDPRAVGRKLNVQAILLGRVTQRGDSLVIGAELVEVQHGWQLWGEQYNRPITDIFAIEEEISREISEKLRPHLTGEDRNRLAKRYTENTAAYQNYLKGRYHLNRVTAASLHHAIRHFENAIQQDHRYALAYTGLADAYGLLAFFGLRAPAEVMPLAKNAALQAVALDETLADAHSSLAGILKSYDWDWPAAEREYHRALELDPNHATIHKMYASFLASAGRPEEAMRTIERAHELEPLSLVIMMEIAWTLHMARNFDRAAAQARRTLELAPEFVPAEHLLGMALEQKGRYEEAAAAFEKSRAAAAGNPATLGGLGHLLAIIGQAEQAREILVELEGIAAGAYVSPYWPALIHTGLGNHAAALDLLEQAVAQRDIWLAWLKTEPRFDNLRADPRFQQLLRRIGLLP
jgi:TolB-like protein/Tfp pilus assembly protein PilF